MPEQDPKGREAASAARQRRINVSTRQYEFAHGTRPRGRGNWAFSFDGGDPEFCPDHTTYSKARAWAIKQARQRGSDSVAVCS